eukprot:superscaffoldBa00000627_g6164
MNDQMQVGEDSESDKKKWSKIALSIKGAAWSSCSRYGSFSKIGQCKQCRDYFAQAEPLCEVRLEDG